MQSLLHNCKVTRVLADGAGSASATPTKGTIIDMAGYSAVMFVAMMGNVLATAAVALKVAGAATNDTAEMALLTGSAGGTAAASDYDDKLVILDVVNPNQQFLEVQVFHVTADAPFDGVIAIQYCPKDAPTTQGSTVVASALLSNPATA